MHQLCTKQNSSDYKDIREHLSRDYMQVNNVLVIVKTTWTVVYWNSREHIGVVNDHLHYDETNDKTKHEKSDGTNSSMTIFTNWLKHINYTHNRTVVITTISWRGSWPFALKEIDGLIQTWQKQHVKSNHHKLVL